MDLILLAKGRSLTVAVLWLTAAYGAGPVYRNPIVFCRGHAAEGMISKIFVMEEDGSKLRQLTQGASYDDHPSFYSDQRHVLYSEFAAHNFDRDGGAKL